MNNTQPQTKKNPYINPLAGGEGWAIEYRYTSKKWEGVYKIWEEGNRERDSKIARIVNDCIFLSASQIHRIVNADNPCSAEVVKKRINYLSRGCYLIKHTIRSGKISYPIYTIGPAACVEDIDIDYENNFYKNYSLTKALKILSINQLFLRLLDSSYAKISHEALNPYDGRIEYLSRKFKNISENREKINTLNIISLRDYSNEYSELERQIGKVDKKTIIIANSYASIERIAGSIKNNAHLFRFTTDELLYKESLNKAFYYIDANQIKLENIKVFE